MYGFGDNEFKKKQDELQKMKFEMDGLEKSFSEMPGIKFGTYDVTGRHNPNPNTTLGKTDLSELMKNDTVGSIYESFQPEDVNLKSELPSENASGGLDFLGSKGTDVASTSVAAERKANKEKFNENRLRREQEFRISEGEDALKNLSKLRKAQMDYLI